jgi:hypothetical protein
MGMKVSCQCESFSYNLVGQGTIGLMRDKNI